MAPWESSTWLHSEQLRRPNTGAQWEQPRRFESPWLEIDGKGVSSLSFEPDRYASISEEVLHSPQRCSQAFRSMQPRVAPLQSMRAGDPRQLKADSFDLDAPPREALPHGLGVREPGRRNMVFESKFDRFAPPRRRPRPHHLIPARPTTVQSAEAREQWVLRGASRAGPRSPRRQPFADASRAFVPHARHVERQLCNLYTSGVHENRFVPQPKSGGITTPLRALTPASSSVRHAAGLRWTPLLVRGER